MQPASPGAVNFLADSDKLRKVLAQSFLITAAYRCSGLISHPPSLKASYWHFDEHAKTDHSTMAANLNVLSSLGLISAAREGAKPRPRRRLWAFDSICRTEYDDALSQALFLGSGGAPRGLVSSNRSDARLCGCLSNPSATMTFACGRSKMMPSGSKSSKRVAPSVNLAQIFPGFKPRTCRFPSLRETMC